MSSVYRIPSGDRKELNTITSIDILVSSWLASILSGGVVSPGGKKESILAVLAVLQRYSWLLIAPARYLLPFRPASDPRLL